jgi:hypothetical protein
MPINWEILRLLKSKRESFSSGSTHGEDFTTEAKVEYDRSASELYPGVAYLETDMVLAVYEKTIKRLTPTFEQVIAEFGIPLEGDARLDRFSWYPGYADTSNDGNPNGVIVADWNELPVGLDSALEKAGYATDWADSTMACDDCGKLVTTQPSCFGWRPYYRFFSGLRGGNPDNEGNRDGSPLCLDCLVSEGDWFLQQFEDKPTMLNTAHTLNPADFDYEKITHFETDPCVYWDKDTKHLPVFAQHHGIYKGLVFNLDKSHDTYMEVSLWARKGEHLEAVQAEIEKELDKIMETNDAAYQQWLARPFRPEEYSIVEATSVLAMLREGAE